MPSLLDYVRWLRRFFRKEKHMPITSWPEWMPDQPSINVTALIQALNVIPRTKDSYGPLANIAAFSDALDDRCQGAFAAKDEDGNASNFAGDAEKLYTLDDTTWTDASKVGGYTTPVTGGWQFEQWGNYVIATNYADAPQAWTLGGAGPFADLDAGAPKAKFVTIWAPGFVVFGYIDDGAVKPNGVRWSGLEDHTSWETVGSAAAIAVQSDLQELQDAGGVMGFAKAVGNFAGAVFCEHGVYRVQYEGPPTIFRFDLVEHSRGCYASGSIVNNGTVCAYLAPDGWYLFTGSASVPIGAQKIDKWFFQDLDQDNLHRISGCVDPINKLFIWAYPGDGSVDGLPNRLLIYNWALGRWSLASMEIELIYTSLSQGYTLETLDDLSATLEGLPFSLDSRAYMGGKAILSGFTSDHEQGSLAGDYLEAVLETSSFALDQGKRVFVSGVRPVVDAASPTISVGAMDDPDDDPTFTTPSTKDRDGVCHMRVSTRYASVRMTVPADSDWGHARGFEPEFQPDGDA